MSRYWGDRFVNASIARAARGAENMERDKDERIAELEADKQRLWDSIEAGESVYKRKCAKLEAENKRLRSALLNSMEWNWLDDDAPERYDLDNLPEVLEDTQ